MIEGEEKIYWSDFHLCVTNNCRKWTLAYSHIHHQIILLLPSIHTWNSSFFLYLTLSRSRKREREREIAWRLFHNDTSILIYTLINRERYINASQEIIHLNTLFYLYIDNDQRYLPFSKHQLLWIILINQLKLIMKKVWSGFRC